MAHEQTITMEADGLYYNIPSVINGKRVPDNEAWDFASKNNTLGKGFPSLKEAEDAAIQRSKSFDTPHMSPTLQQPKMKKPRKKF